MTLYLFLRNLLSPPAPQILLVLAGLALLRRRPWLGRSLVATGLGMLYLMATPLGAGLLAQGLETAPALPADPRAWGGAQAIVVLGGGRQPAPEFGGRDMPNYWTASRLRYGAALYRRSGLPLAVSGGVVGAAEVETEAAVMARSLREDHVVNVRWQEGGSRTTWENAQLTRRLLAPQGVDRIVLVTQGLHMRRARFAFEQAGFTVVPAPLDLVGPGVARRPLVLRLAPSSAHFMVSAQALHEYGGLVAYRLRALAD